MNNLTVAQKNVTCYSIKVLNPSLTSHCYVSRTTMSTMSYVNWRSCKLLLQTINGDRRSEPPKLCDEWIQHVCCSSLTLNLCNLQKQVKTSSLKKHQPLILTTTMKTVLQQGKITLIKITVTLPPFARVIDNWDHSCSHHQLEKVSFKPLQTFSSMRTPAAWCMSVFIGANMSASLIKRHQE